MILEKRVILSRDIKQLVTRLDLMDDICKTRNIRRAEINERSVIVLCFAKINI